MRRIILLVLVLAALNLWALDPVYHSYEEIIAELDSLQQIYSDIMMVRLMGYTATDNQPVYAVKISDNVQMDEDEPAVLFLGQCHAEEVIGVEISMNMINEILLYQNANPYNMWINNIEIWIWPTHNPEGLQVVTDEWDTSFRKNKRDNNENGIFDYTPVVGHDIDGVDLNRNYSFNWVHSDTLYTPGGNELWDYYRGPAPFSEMEAQMVKELADEQHFIYSIAWHSSRTGYLAEQVIYPWNWSENKPCADLDFHTAFANYVAHLIPNQNGNASGYYEPSATIGRNSKAHDWFYNEYGTLQFEIEAGTSNLQPLPALLEDTIDRCKAAPYYMMNRVLGYNADAAMLTGHVTDAVSGEPLPAEYIIEERTAPSFKPRLCDELYGRYWWQCSPGSYTLRIRHKGYEDNVQTVTVNNSMWTTRNVELQPLPEATLNGEFTFDGQPQTVNITARHVMGDEVFTVPAQENQYELDWWEGEIELLFHAPGYASKFIQLDLAAGSNELNVNFEEEVLLFSESWGDDFSQWNVDGGWYIGIEDEFGIPCAKDNPNRYYTNGSEAVLEIDRVFNFNGASDLSLQFFNKYHTEHGYDLCQVEARIGGSENWNIIASYSGVSAREGVSAWQLENLDLNDLVDRFVRLRFRLVTDNSVDDPGWWIGEMKITSATEVEEEEDNLVAQTIMKASYPNPFLFTGSRASASRIEFSLAEAGEAQLSVYNLKGQKVKNLIDEYMSAGQHFTSWDGTNNQGEITGSGVYFYQLKTESKIINRKMILIK